MFAMYFYVSSEYVCICFMFVFCICHLFVLVFPLLVIRLRCSLSDKSLSAVPPESRPVVSGVAER